jgi:CrcB protein
MQTWLSYFWVAFGGALGGVGRYWLSGIVATRLGERFPWGTLVVNLSGSLLIGFLAALNLPEGRFHLAPTTRQFLMVGLCGGYTTFSSFSLQTLTLLQEGEWLQAGGNVFLSVTLCLFGVWLGFLLGAALNSTKGA